MASIRSGIGENMEDRYLFKAKHFEKWHIGNIVKEPDGLYIRDIKENVMAQIDDESTICQCTGLKDKNGKPIWENDIVSANGTLYVCRFDEDNFELEFQNCKETIGICCFHSSDIGIVGNIFDNPKLLEVGE